jgi:hypothetical protein
MKKFIVKPEADVFPYRFLSATHWSPVKTLVGQQHFVHLADVF